MRLHYLAIGQLLPLPTLALAQANAPAPFKPSINAILSEEDPDIIVTGSARPRASVIGDIKPELVIGPADIRSMGVSSISDLLSQLAPQTTSGRGGSPVVLLNGKRMSSFSEIRNIPTEAIARVDILPEEVALKYGYTSDQKVVNIVLRQRFRAYTGEINLGTTTDGGGENGSAEASYLRIRNGGRLNIDVKYTGAQALDESERNITDAAPRFPYDLTGNLVTSDNVVHGVPASAATSNPTKASFGAANQTNLGAYRTLAPQTRDFSTNLVYNNNIFGNVSATFNASLDLSNSDGLNGLPSVGLVLLQGNLYNPFPQNATLYRYINTLGPLTQNSQTTSGHLGLTLNADFSKQWHWSFTSTYDGADNRAQTMTGINASALNSALVSTPPSFNPYGALPVALLTPNPAATSDSVSNTISADALVYGTLFKLPAGDVSTSIKGALSHARLTSSSSRLASSLHQQQSNEVGQINVDLPIANAKKNVLKGLGDLTLNANAGVQHYDVFGTLSSLGYGLNWSPVSPLTVIVSMTTDHTAPSVSQLANPITTTPNSLVYDPLNGNSYYLTVNSGGNPNLKASTRHVLKLETNYKPFEKKDLTFNITYTRTRTNNPINTPTLAQAFAAAPTDASGNPLSIDQTPVNFVRAENDQVRWGINFSQPIKSHRKLPPGALSALFGNRRPGGDGPNGGGDRGGDRGDRGNAGGGGNRGGGGGGRGGFGSGQGGFGAGRFQIALYHTMIFHDTLLVNTNQPVLDLLHGGAQGSSGGQPRHEIEVQAGISKDGYGARFTADWQSATNVTGTTAANTLHFGSLATANFRIFANLGQQPELVMKHHWLRGTRVMLSINNLFNARQLVTDATGMNPLSYQPDLLDPQGRIIKLTFRKLLF